jgi:hypothetical protein
LCHATVAWRVIVLQAAANFLLDSQLARILLFCVCDNIKVPH